MSGDSKNLPKLSPEEVNRRIEYAFDHPEIIQAAIAKGIEDARRQYAAAGMPMASWDGEKVIWVDPTTLETVERPKNLPKLN